MATNSQDTYISGARGVDVYPGVANPTEASISSNPMETNFVNDPTDPTTGAGAAGNFTGHQQAQRNFKETAGVVEGRPGIIESSNIDPLNENSNKDDGWANARSTSTAGAGTTVTSTASSVTSTAMNAASSAATMATGAARMAYGHAMGDEAAKQAGKEAVWGKQ